MTHESFTDAKIVPGVCSLIGTNDTVFVSLVGGAIVLATKLVQLGDSDWLVDSSGSASSRVFLTFKFTSVGVDVHQRT